MLRPVKGRIDFYQFFYNLLQQWFVFREHGRRLAEQKDLLSQPVTPTEPPLSSVLFRTVEDSAAASSAAGKCRSNAGGGSKFHLDAAFIRRVMDFERSSPLLSPRSSASASSGLSGTSLPRMHDLLAHVKEGEIRRPNDESTIHEASSDRTPIRRDEGDVGRRRKRRRTKEERQNPRTLKRYRNILNFLKQIVAEKGKIGWEFLYLLLGKCWNPGAMSRLIINLCFKRE